MSINGEIIRDRERFLSRYRIAYLAAVSRELGFVTSLDLHDMALREAAAMLELARELAAGPRKSGK